MQHTQQLGPCCTTAWVTSVTSSRSAQGPGGGGRDGGAGSGEQVSVRRIVTAAHIGKTGPGVEFLPSSTEQIAEDNLKMNIFDRDINFDALFKFSQISHSTQQHLKNVYSSLAVCMFVAATGSYVHVATRLFQGGLLSMLGSLAMMIWLLLTPHNSQTEKKRLAILAGFAFFTGVGLGPVLDFVITVNPSIIVTALLGTSVIFVCFTLSALYAQRRSYLFLGGVLMSGLSVLFLISLVNMFVGSAALFKAHVYVGLVIMCGFVLFDTQLIIEKAEMGDKDYIWHCVDLFLDFVTIFRKLMVILAMNEKDKKKEKK
ncbi:putative Bax inhibitor 1 [Arapaima gigas]